MATGARRRSMRAAEREAGVAIVVEAVRGAPILGSVTALACAIAASALELATVNVAMTPSAGER